MPLAPLYLLNRFLFRISDFFHHWYVDGSRTILHYFVSVFENLDMTFAVWVTLRNFWKPLYGDYTIVGRILGLVFRSMRVIFGVSIYLALAPIALVAYLTWFAIPFAILFMIYRSHLTGTA